MHGPKRHKKKCVWLHNFQKQNKKDDVNCNAWTDELQKYLKGYKDKRNAGLNQYLTYIHTKNLKKKTKQKKKHATRKKKKISI